MPKYLSGRQKLRPANKLTEDRYQYLGLDQAEPNLADPLTSPGVPSGTQYQLVAVAGYDGRRYWVPVGGAVIPGAITIFDEGAPVSSASSITQMNFVGAAVTAQVSVQSPSGHPGIAATVTVIPVNIGENPPASPPITGELWWESDTGDLYVYYDDGDSAQWVMANSGGRGLTGDKGEIGPKGEKGQKGEVGNTGSQGDKGEKGAPSTVAGDKGQKGEVGVGQKGEPSTVKGDKGQKGEVGAAGNDGNNGDKGQKGESGGGGGGASVTISDTAPGSASNGDLWWESDTFDLHVYYQDGSSNQWVSITSNAALKGEKGDTGDKGQKGEVGQKGDTGDKGQKGEIGPAGGTGGQGTKGDKGQKGEVGSTGSDGSDGDKGQKVYTGAQGTGGSGGDKGQKGDTGAQGAGGSGGDKGQKGEAGAGQTPAFATTQTTGGTTTSHNFQTVMTITITPTQSSSALLITSGGTLRGDFIPEQTDEGDSSSFIEAQLFRGNTALGVSCQPGTSKNAQGFYLAFKDTNNHGGSAVTYHLKFRRIQTNDMADEVAIIRGSSLVVQEII